MIYGHPILQMGKVRLREITRCAQGHAAGEGLGQDLSSHLPHLREEGHMAMSGHGIAVLVPKSLKFQTWAGEPGVKRQRPGSGERPLLH